MMAYDVGRGRWRVLTGPSPQEHPGVTTLGGHLYVVAGRLHGQPLSIVQRWSPASRRWERLASIPEPRGATAASLADGQIVDAGAESAAGTSAAVYACNPKTNRWRRLPDQPIARHSVAVVGVGSTISVVGGGPTPGLTVTAANESLNLSG